MVRCRQETEAMTEPDIRYTEVVGEELRTLPVRRCRLRTDGDEPVAELELLSFRQRVGATAVAMEGIGGVETQPDQRRRGHVSRLLRQALAGAAQRVHVAVISDAIEELYEKFGFVTAAPQGQLVVAVRNVERPTGADLATAEPGVRSATPADLSAMIRLYNTAHAERPWTHERHAGWNRLTPQTTWRPGSETLVLEANDGVMGYAVVEGRAFGSNYRVLAVDELVAQDADGAGRLLTAVAQRAWRLRLSEFTVREPADSVVGRVARHMGCTYQQTYPPSGGTMAAILNRPGLLREVEPELRRRAGGLRHNADHDVAFAALLRGDLILDNRPLIRLLLGYWSAEDALADDVPVSAPPYWDLCEAWFPGGGTPTLPMPYVHHLDRY
jgi:predicted GNAT family N-acyltransferase